METVYEEGSAVDPQMAFQSLLQESDPRNALATINPSPVEIEYFQIMLGP